MMRCSYCGDDVHDGRLVSENDYVMLDEKINGVDCMVIVHRHCVGAYKAAMAEEGSRLKPCPFCGATVTMTDITDGTGSPLYCINHPTKKCILYGDTMFYNSKEMLIEHWNRRVKR